MRRSLLVPTALSLAILASRPSAFADAKAPPTAGSGDQTTATTQARVEFNSGAAFADAARWGEALAAFERSAALRAHPLTTYNIGACERALGRYTRARKALKAAFSENEAGGGTALSGYAEQAKAYLLETEKLLVRLRITLPSGAAFAVDGRAVVQEGDLMVAGIAAPGSEGVPQIAAPFDLLLDPGAHMFVASRKGYGLATISRSYSSGMRDTLAIALEKLPARIRVEVAPATVNDAVVTLGGLDLGVAPVVVSRPAGTYEVVVRKVGYVTYRSRVDVKPGDEVSLRANLGTETTPITRQWWFWTAAGVVVGGAVVGTYLITRPAPERPAPDGGGLGWVVTAQ